MLNKTEPFYTIDALIWSIAAQIVSVSMPSSSRIKDTASGWVNTALETMNIYAPIAHRLGMRTIKDEIEDLAFRYLDPYAYGEIEQMLRIRGR